MISSVKELINLDKVESIVNKFSPEFIVHAGDIVNEIDKDVDLENYLKFSNNINIKIHHIPGNHDVGIDPNNLSMKGLEFYKENFGNDFYNFNWKGFELIFLNGSKFINYQNSNIYNEQLNFIKETLKNFKSHKRIIVFMHQPPYIDEKDILSRGEKDLHGKDISYWAFENKINENNLSINKINQVNENLKKEIKESFELIETDNILKSNEFEKQINDTKKHTNELHDKTNISIDRIKNEFEDGQKSIISGIDNKIKQLSDKISKNV